MSDDGKLYDCVGTLLEVGDLVVYAVQDKYAHYDGKGTSTRMRLGRITKLTERGKVSIQRIGPPELAGWHRTVTSVYPTAVAWFNDTIPEGWY